jgi:hypothetical protein
MDVVECHSGYEYAVRPTALYWQGERLLVEEVLAGWRLPDGKRFRVRTTDQSLFELSYIELTGEWQIQPL